MPTRFIGKNIRKKVVRPIKNSVKNRHFKEVKTQDKPTEAKTEVVVDTKEEETVKEAKKENKKQKKSKDMVSENKLEQMETIAGTATNVKIEKPNNGLYERTENSTVLLTEDNKMLLND